MVADWPVPTEQQLTDCRRLADNGATNSPYHAGVSSTLRWIGEVGNSPLTSQPPPASRATADDGRSRLVVRRQELTDVGQIRRRRRAFRRYRRDHTWWTRIASCDMSHPTGSCTAYVLEWGVVVFDISHRLQLPNVTALANWRKNAHGATFEQGTALVRELLGDPTIAGPEYVLSAFWVEEPMWAGSDLDTAMRLMCVPSVFLNRQLEDEETLVAKAEVA